MTTPKMIALCVIVVAVLIALFITITIAVYDEIKRKRCNHLCGFCEYKEDCDWYQMRKSERR